MTAWFLFGLAALLIGSLLTQWRREARLHDQRLARIDVRIHVNGIRGKSTVARIVAGLLRESGRTTLAKTTGTSAVVIGPDGTDTPIERRGAPTILEQIGVLENCEAVGADALVVECMALNPAYQAISERRMVRSNIGVITNVREDHQDVMGPTLPDIARALINTCPENGVLITAEQEPELQAILREGAEARGSKLIVANPDWVRNDEVAAFDYIAFKENIAIGLAIAYLLGISRPVAMAGMVSAPADPGVLRLQHARIGSKHVTWANLFAVNDRQSVAAVMEAVMRYQTSSTTTVGILNNRLDRADRALQFADIATEDLSFDRLVTFGAYERSVTERLVATGYPRVNIIQLGESVDPDAEEILEWTVHAAPTPHVLLVGLVNIHTKQAEILLDYFESLEEAAQTESEQAA